jgi:hypothetical protein
MSLPRSLPLAFVPGRPRWLTLGMLRLATLSAFVVAVEMVRVHLTQHSAWLVVGVGAGIGVVLGAVLLGATRRLERSLGIRWASRALVLVLRRIGLPLIGLAFFLAWTLVYMGVWAVHPDDAFTGLAKEPRFADFFYFAVLTGLTAPPGDLFAHSRGARAASMIEIMTALALLTAYLSGFVDWHRFEPPAPMPDDG